MGIYTKIKKEYTSLSVNTNDVLFFLLLASAYLGSGLSFGKVYLLYLIFPIYLVYHLFFKKNEFIVSLKNLLTRNRLSNMILLFLLVYFLIRLPFTDHLYYSFRHLFFLGLGITIIFLIQEYVKSLKTLKIFLFSCLILVGFDIIIGTLEALQFFRWPISSLSQYNEFFHRNELLSGILSETRFKTYVNSMPTSVHWNPNNYATAILLILPFILLWKNFKTSAFLIILIIILVIAAGSKTAYLGAILIMFSSLFFYKGNLKNILVLLTVLLLTSTNGFNQFRETSMKVDEVQNLIFSLLNIPLEESEASIANQGSADYRRILIENGFILLKEQPIFGVGGGISQALIEIDGGVGEKKITNLHNFWLELIVEGGLILGVLLLIWVVYNTSSLIKTIIKNDPKSLVHYLASAGLLSAVGLLISGIGPSSMIGFFPFYIFVGYILVINSLEHHYATSGLIEQNLT